MSFSASLVATLTLVLISTVLLSACAPQTGTPAEGQPETPAIEESVETNTSSTPEQNSNTNDATVTEGTEEGTQEISLEPSYISPGGEEKIAILLTVANGIVTEAEATSLAKNPTSKQMQAGFVQAFSGAVVGKSINELQNVDRIGGASLTTGAFRKALSELEQS